MRFVLYSIFVQLYLQTYPILILLLDKNKISELFYTFVSQYEQTSRKPSVRRSSPTEMQQDRRFQNIYRTECPVKHRYLKRPAIEIYSLPVSTANGIKFRFQFYQNVRQRLEICLFILSDRHVPLCNRNSYQGMLLYVNVNILLVGTSTCKTWNIKTEIYY